MQALACLVARASRLQTCIRSCTSDQAFRRALPLELTNSVLFYLKNAARRFKTPRSAPGVSSPTILLDTPRSPRENTVSLIVTIPIRPRGTKRGKSELFEHEWGGGDGDSPVVHAANVLDGLGGVDVGRVPEAAAGGIHDRADRGP